MSCHWLIGKREHGLNHLQVLQLPLDLDNTKTNWVRYKMTHKLDITDTWKISNEL